MCEDTMDFHYVGSLLFWYTSVIELTNDNGESIEISVSLDSFLLSN